jgi:glycosyltransferase involved in cell wall biosynthesis
MDYIVVVPARNEERRLPLMVKCLADQTVPPRVCVIVDDGSTDSTSRTVEELRGKFTWIHCVTLPGKGEDTWRFLWEGTLHFARVISEGARHAQEICAKNSITYQYVGKVDADFILPSTYFEELLGRFQEDPALGIASGDVYYLDFGTNPVGAPGGAREVVVRDTPSDGARVYRRECLEAIGGFPVTLGADSVALAKARLLGWRTRRFEDIKAFATRRSIGGGRAWRGYKLAGYEAYCLGCHPVLVLLRAAVYLLRRPHYHALAWLYGYALGLVHGTGRSDDEEVRLYFRQQRLAEVRGMVLNAVRDTLRRQRRRVSKGG